MRRCLESCERNNVKNNFSPSSRDKRRQSRDLSDVATKAPILIKGYTFFQLLKEDNTPVFI